MANGEPVGTIFAELDLDDTPYKKAQDKLYEKVSGTAKNIEQNYKNLADKTASAFESMQKSVSDQFDKMKGYAISASVAIADFMKRAFVGIGNDIKNSLGSGWEKVKETFSNIAGHLKTLAEQFAAVWVASKLWGTAAGTVLGAVFNWVAIIIVAFKSLNFVIGLFTGKSYKSDHIDALVEETKAVEALRAQLQVSTRDAQSYKAAMDRLGVGQDSITAVFEGYRTALRDNRDEMDRLGVKYQDANGKLLDQRTAIENTKNVLDQYTEGWDRNQAAAAIGMGTYEQINDYLKITQAELGRSRESLDIYHLGIGPETQKAVNEYNAAMLEFRAESKLMADGLSRAIADQIMPAFTTLANWFKGGWPGVVDAFRYGMAQITSLLWGLKLFLDIVWDSWKLVWGNITDVVIYSVVAIEKVLSGDFAGAKNTLISGWENIKDRASKTWQEMVADANKASSAMKLAWGFDDRTAPAKGAPKQGKKWEPPPEKAAEVTVADQSNRIYQALSMENKRIYDTEVERQEHLSKIRQLNGEDELNFFNEVINAKENALNRWFDEQKNIIIKTTKDEELYNARIGALNAEYNKQWQKYQDIRQETALQKLNNQAKSYADFYQELTGYEDKYRENQLNWIERERERKAKFYKDEVAAAKWAADQKGKMEYDLLKKKTDYIQVGLAAMQSSFNDMASIYAEGSSEAKRWQDAAKALEIAQRGVAVVQAVAAIATQGLGDPYTAFARIAAMTATMIALLASIGESVHGGSAAAAPSMSTNTATGLGSTEGSQSVDNSYKMLSETYKMEDRRLNSIYQELQDLNGNITGLVTSIVRTGGVSNFAAVPEGSNGWQQAGFERNMEYFNKLVNFGPTMLDKLFKSGGANILGGINTAITKGVGWIIGGMFGGKTSYETSESGIQLIGQSIRDIQAGASAIGQYYNVIKKTVDGGWFKKDKISYQTYYQAMGGDTIALFTQIYRGLSETMIGISEELGADMNKTLNYTFSGFTLDLKGKTTEEISKAISSAVSAMGDTAVQALFGDILSRYQKINEGLLETAIRIIQQKQVVAYWLDKTNQVFRGTTSAAIEFSDTLVTIAGGLDKLTESMQTYYDRFFSDSEKQAKLRVDLMGGLSAYGYDLPGTRAGYRSLVESLNLTTAAGQAAYVALMQMAESADQYYSYIEDAKSRLSEGQFATRADYLRAVGSFAEGGISSGPDTGYLAELHGTELVVSPRNAYPAKVVGADSPELAAKIDRLIEAVEAGNFNNAKNGIKVVRALDLLEQEMKTEGVLTRTS